ncbi:manganese and iron superoxide dismutase [Basidiobolus meristosporus CBS 931.73]|uniref:Superoxide dismutase n=1 Tax=Basidiobolus meristosporus CBS 931.73 TaxID=1314790 RepID=A0A1Y1YCU2_9FUNG|nr:manganese and iron superoxide dismutase [Basidiobolus meristosporus CBS 931.73]|eukprot:ORX95434.1 manganese and iron superoxide dismutase [Basidiobolus meristosporus CBS 931.73]
MFRARSLGQLCGKVARPLQRQQKSLLHELTPLPYSAEQGLKPLFSSRALGVVYAKNQQKLIDRLNTLVAGTEHEDQNVFETMLMTYKQPSKAAIYNYASQAWNTDFFLQTLTAEPRPIKADLKAKIARHFSSFENFQEQFTKAASSIFGSGWTWLVEDERGVLRIVNTLNSGNPITTGRLQQFDANTSSVEETTDPSSDKVSTQKPTGAYAPILALNMWEHAYVVDFGVDGKEQYIQAFWQSVDWDKVHGRVIRSPVRA